MTARQPFIVFSLPRSRSAWLSVFLSHGGRMGGRDVGHDIGIDCASPEDFLDRLGDGTCETGAAFAWRLIRRERPDIKFAVVRRPPLDVSASLAKFGLKGLLPEMERRFAHMEHISALPGTLTVDFAELATVGGARALYEHCLDEPFDLRWWRRLDVLNIQVDIERRLLKLATNQDQTEALKAEVARRLGDA